ncbi:membrane fusion protein (multidrug efflux system) [Azospirillum agricola]|uniref:efflux RND transporter periplasmic adaptor subunit n=1 Tax=Azospirillum agricola TaxID=1720247 RepID=UPI001AE53D9B|nr:efflux RND transporter periplasmic adaptor subunit [Azospirillum agricola]MBP2228825.1 membrane fusion protein (multidrug efflux system) [Azospirillum agricola]
MTASSARHAFPGFLAAPLAASLLLAVCTGPALAQTAPPPPEVTAILVQAQDVPLSFEYAGRVAGSREVEVRARVGGILLERTYVEGSVVKQGDVLFRLDPEPYRVKLARAEAQLRQEQARLLQADRNWKRIEPLFQRETVSGRERDEALSALDLARASVAVAEAEVRAAKIDLDYTQVKAPVSGVTSRETMSEGSLVDTGSNGLLTNITQLDPVYVNFAIPDAEATIYREEIAKGTVAAPADGHLPVDVRTANGTVLGGSGQINYTDSTVDPRTGTIRARAVVANPDNRLLPGQFVRAVVKGMTLKNAIAVPQKAVMQGPQGTFVYVVPGEGAVQAQIRPVRLGRAVGDRFVVADGLKSGDRLITEGVIKVRPGATVKAVAPAAPAPAAPAPAASPAKEAAR